MALVGKSQVPLTALSTRRVDISPQPPHELDVRLYRPKGLGGGILRDRAEDREGARITMILVHLHVDREETHAIVVQSVMMPQPIDDAHVSLGIVQLGAKAYAGECGVPRL